MPKSAEPAVTFSNPDRIPFALAMLDCWLGNADRKARTESILAETFGHADYPALVYASSHWTPDAVAYGPETKARQAWLLSTIVGRTEDECAGFLDLLNVGDEPIDEEEVLQGLSDHFEGDPSRDGILKFFGGHPFLLNDADFALRLRKAGKQDRGIGTEGGPRADGALDILDAFTASASLTKGKETFQPAVAMAIYYSAPAHATVWCDNVFALYDHMPYLLKFEEEFEDMTALFDAARGFPANSGLDFRTFSDLFRERQFPLPQSHEELASAVAVHHALRDATMEFAGILHPNHVMPAEEWMGSWQAMEEYVGQPQCQMDFLEAARGRIADFVDGYAEDDRSGSWVNFENWNFFELVRESVTVSRSDDAALARYLAADGGRTWNTPDDEDSIEVAVARFGAGVPKRKKAPRPEVDLGNVRDMPEVQEAEQSLMDVARGRVCH